MVNIEGFKDEKMKGILVGITKMPLTKYLATPEKIKAFEDGMSKYPDHIKTATEKENYRNARLKSEVLVFRYSVTLNNVTKENTEFMNIPQITGWGRSKLKDMRDLNNLPYTKELEKDWLNKEVWIYINKDGFLRLLPDT